MGVTQQWLRDQANVGMIPCLKAGSRYLFNLVAVFKKPWQPKPHRRGKGATMRSSTATKPALLLTPQQAAEALAISPRKCWGMTASGKIPHIRLGRCVRYPVDDLRRWIESKEGANA